MRKNRCAQLHFLCFGVGAIGTYIGGSLALAGHKVVFYEREEVAKIIQKRGLHLQLLDGNYHYSNPDVVTTIDEALTHGPFDVCIFAVKSYDTEELLKKLYPYHVALPPFLCFQNGVENEHLLAKNFGQEKVMSGTITTAVGRSGLGKISVEKMRGVGVSSDHILTPTLVDVLENAGLNARQYANARGMKWSKLITNIIGNATSAILDMPVKEIYSNPRLYRLELQQIREALAVMAANKIPVINLPGTPVKLLAWAIKNLPDSLSQPLVCQSIGKGRGEKMPSFHIDLHSGSGKSEVEYLNGAVVRFGESAGIPTPVNRLLTQTLMGIVRGDINGSEYSQKPEKLLEQLMI